MPRCPIAWTIMGYAMLRSLNKRRGNVRRFQKDIFSSATTAIIPMGKRFADLAACKNGWIGGPENTDDAPRYGVLPNCMDNHGVCNEAQPQQADGQCAPIPAGHFFVENTGYYSNGQAFLDLAACKIGSHLEAPVTPMLRPAMIHCPVAWTTMEFATWIRLNNHSQCTPIPVGHFS